MTNEPAKRSAIEPASVLFEVPASEPGSSKRPASLTLGTGLVALRAAGGISVISTLSRQWPELRGRLDLDASDAEVAFKLLIGAQIGWILAALIVAWLTWRGGNLARLLVMTLTSISITTAAISHFTVGGQITIHTTLLTVSLDILILLALSDRDVRIWTRGHRRARNREHGRPGAPSR